jgi:sporulation inhibitor KapD
VVQHLLFLDFEFSMPEKEEKVKGFISEIIEAGIVSVVDGKVEKTFNAFVRPEFQPVLTDRCKEFLGIRQEEVDQGISFTELLDVISGLVRENTTIVTWGNMDLVMLRKSCELRGIVLPFRARELDLSMEYMNFYGDRNQTGLMKALRELGKTTERRHHRALDDALTTFEIFQLIEKDKKYLEKPESPCIGDLIDLSGFFSS